MPNISVIMPAYNVEAYIGAAIESVLNQTYRDFELIVINDGSTDSTGKIIEEFSKRDRRIKPCHIENKGVSNARNLGLSWAKGDYVTFVDSDDRINNDYLEWLYHLSQEHIADISICTFYRYNESDNNYYYTVSEEGDDFIKSFTYQEILDHLYDPKNSYNVILTVAWGKLYRKSLFENIVYPEGKLHEDSFTTYKVYLKADKIIYSNAPKYMYRVRNSSIMSSGMTREKIKDQLEQEEEKLALFSAAGIPVPPDLINDYYVMLGNLKQAALNQGFIKEYHMIRQKLDFIDLYKSKF